MPPIKFNPKYKLYTERIKQEGVTDAGRHMTDDFIKEEVPNFAKPMTKDIVDGYRAVVDFPTDVFRIMVGISLFYILWEVNKK